MYVELMKAYETGVWNCKISALFYSATWLDKIDNFKHLKIIGGKYRAYYNGAFSVMVINSRS